MRIKDGRNGGGTPPHRSKQWKAFLYREGKRISTHEGTLLEIKAVAFSEGATGVIAGWNFGGNKSEGVRYYIANPNTRKYNPVPHRTFVQLTGIE